MANKVIFVPICADFVHVGHVNILEGAATHGDVHVLLMTDLAMEGYKRAPCMSYRQRERILRAIKHVSAVIPCDGPHTYADMCREHEPAAFCHGDDWKTGPQAQGRLEVMAELEKYGGKVIEPEVLKPRRINLFCFPTAQGLVLHSFNATTVSFQIQNRST